jgi:hypothetical protein
MESTNKDTYPIIDKVKRIIRDNQDLFVALEESDRTGKLRKASYKKRYNFTLDEDLMQRYRTHCQKNSINMSAKIESMIREFMKSNSN